MNDIHIHIQSTWKSNEGWWVVSTIRWSNPPDGWFDSLPRAISEKIAQETEIKTQSILFDLAGITSTGASGTAKILLNSDEDFTVFKMHYYD